MPGWRRAAADCGRATRRPGRLLRPEVFPKPVPRVLMLAATDLGVVRETAERGRLVHPLGDGVSKPTSSSYLRESYQAMKLCCNSTVFSGGWCPARCDRLRNSDSLCCTACRMRRTASLARTGGTMAAIDKPVGVNCPASWCRSVSRRWTANAAAPRSSLSTSTGGLALDRYVAAALLGLVIRDLDLL